MELNVLEIPRLSRWERFQHNLVQTARRIGSLWVRAFLLCVAVGLAALGIAAVTFVAKMDTCRNSTATD